VRSTVHRRRFARRAAGPLAAAFALALAAGPAAADEPAESEALSPGEIVDLFPTMLGKGRVRLYTEQRGTLLADFGPADASELRSTFGVRAGGSLTDSLGVRVTAVGDASFLFYDGDASELADELELGSAGLFDELYDFSFGVGGAYRLPWTGVPWSPTLFGMKPAWSLFAEGRAKMSWEDGARLADAVKGSGTFGVGFELDSTFELALGLDVSSRIDKGGASVNPVFGLRWRFRDDMQIETHGLGLVYTWEVCPELELQLRGSWEGDRYRLDDRGAPLDAGILRQREAPVLVALRWEPSDHWRFVVGLGSVVYQKWRVEPEDGEGSNSVSAGPSALGWLRIEYRF
jgi:hypothetical protein